MTNIAPLLEKAKQKGSELDYIQWLHQWPSCLTGTYSEWHDGRGFCEAAHVRHVSLGSGTGIKPEYMAVPLTGEEHRLTHSKGDSVFYPPEWWEQKAIEYLVKWLNGVNPPEPREVKEHWKKEYVITSSGHVLAIWLMVKKFFAMKPDGAVKITIERAVRRRSNKQNRYYFGVVVPLVKKFLIERGNIVGDDFVHGFLKAEIGGYASPIELPCGRIKMSVDSSKKLSTVEWESWMEKIRNYFEKYGLLIPLPNEVNFYDY